MDRVWSVVATYQWWLYGFVVLLLLFFLRRAILARRESARSIFKLEQEQARTRYSRSVWVMVVLLVVAAAVYGVTNLLVPGLNRPPEPTPTSTSGPLPAATLTPTPPQPSITPTPTATKVQPTKPAVPTATPQVAVTPTPAVRPPNCPNPNVRLTSPGANQVVRGAVAVRGSANIAAFDYYKVEVGPGANPADGAWAVVGELHRSPVVNGLLETWNSDAYPAGTYSLRLVVVDGTGNFPDPCRVTVVVQR